MKKQIKDLELYEIDFLVAKAEVLIPFIEDNKCFINDITDMVSLFDPYEFSPTTNPVQAWPIIERESISMIKSNTRWMARTNENDYIVVSGKKSLEAAMRCFVASKFGDEVEL